MLDKALLLAPGLPPDASSDGSCTQFKFDDRLHSYHNDISLNYIK